MIRKYGYLILCNGVFVALLALGALNHISAQVKPRPSFAFLNGW
jgi:hypothetical protein